MQDTEYIPYGEEWKKEISKLPKAAIIEMAAKLGQEKADPKKTAPVVGSASQLVDCADCDYRHDKTERIEKKGKVWTTYHCPKCGCESTCRVS